MWAAVVAAAFCSLTAGAQTCQTAKDMGESSRTALVATAQRYFAMVTQGDVASLRQNAIPGLAGSFGGIEAVVTEQKPNLAGTQPVVRPPFLLLAQGTAPFERAEFLCGVFGKAGQTADSTVFVIPGLPPGDYAAAILDVTTAKGPYTVTFVLQQLSGAWKLAGMYVKSSLVAGHDAKWYIERGRAFKAKGQTHNAWLYFLQGRDLLVPVAFMSTMETDKLYDEMQAGLPADLASAAHALQITAQVGLPGTPQVNKTFSVVQMFPLAVGNDLNLIVKYQAADISNTGQIFQDNMGVIRAMVTKYPEFREGFAGVVARAVDPTGRDFGSMLAMKDIK
jgi:hypothetical protein